MPSVGEIKQILSRTYAEWNAHQAPRLGAALAYYTCLSLAPLLILLIALAGLVLGQDAATGRLFEQIRDMVGVEGAKAIEQMIQNASKPASGVLASIIGFATLLFGASSVAAELRNSLNVIWGQPTDPNAGIKDMVKERSYALVVVLGCGFLLVVSLVVSSGIAAAGTFVSGMLPLPAAVLQAFNFLLSLAVLTVVFALLFKYLPDVEMQWRDVLLGAAFTSLLFSIGKLLIGMYLGKASFGSTYGAAGSLVIVLVWVYYSSQIFFFGAEFTQVYAREHGSDPCRKKQQPRVQTTPSPVVASYAHQAATGNAGLQPDGDVAAKAGSLIGTVVAFSRAVTAIWKK